MDNSNSTINLDNTGLVILYGRELESILRKLGASGTGAGELANSVKEEIPESLFRDICYMISIRNRFAHSSDDPAKDVPADFDPEDYREFAESTLRRLKKLSARRNAASADIQSTQKKAGDKSSRQEQELSPEAEDFIRFKAELRRRCRLLGCIPLFNWAYFFMLFLSAFSSAALWILVLLTTLLSIPPFINGFTYSDNIHIVCGIALSAAGYIWSAAIFRHLQDKPAWYWWLPGPHLLYQCAVIGKLIRWKRLLIAAAGLALDAGAVAVLFKMEAPWKYFIIFTASAYLMGLAHLVFCGHKDRKEDES